MKPVPTALLFFSLAVIADANILSVFKRSVANNYLNALSVRKTLKDLNMTIVKYFKQIEDYRRMGFLDCEGTRNSNIFIHSIFTVNTP